ncbi:hypothetical protein CDG76_24100 [Nostoc sp. 'Peltigera membranacea cyanobiont' 210A]|uniref:hypothetical protein n=1 Tax=Nostoc sp. 'Peltigera membranacea cyanobiont' 210A TaxID=2014529 RepID=UPI000B955A47|nr:hypothetical protein [Nostoc sp. 'Peltigera membranacea cyanobiont' 210A]OYD92596.1 hypothetical protein CDG76_24100 [Nostoc sp. 'Peltigera membranacea cyanobiont' 210A]
MQRLLVQSCYAPIFEKRKAIRTQKNFPAKYFGFSDNLLYSGISYLVESQIMTMNMQRLIKKTSNPIRKITEETPPSTEPIEMPESQDIPESVVEPNLPVYMEASESDYICEHYRPLRSVGNSGWQPSDVWRELRVDNFCG